MWTTLYGTRACRFVPPLLSGDQDYVRNLVAELRTHPDCPPNAKPFVVAVEGYPYIVMRESL